MIESVEPGFLSLAQQQSKHIRLNQLLIDKGFFPSSSPTFAPDVDLISGVSPTPRGCV